VGVCVEATPPALDAASGFAWDDTVRLQAEGSDTSRDPTATDHLSRDEGDRFVGRAVAYVGPRVAAVMQALRVTLVDARGWRSRRRSSRVRASPATSTASTTSAPPGTAARRRSAAASAASRRPARSPYPSRYATPLRDTR